ncbi:MAG: MlaD family protein [Candidatus Dormibacteria bacterium]|jgi:phospholipid/cholesterol/gamma-HCH transport system substrate-binding protein
MRSRWNLPIYLGYMLLCLLVLGFVVRGLEFSVPWTHPYQLTATFTDADSILPNNEVFLNGTKVGYVGAVNGGGGHAQVQLVFDNGNALPLHPDATAQVRKKNLLGETYIDLTRGSQPGQLQSGGVIPVSQTVPITEIDQVLAVFDPATVQRVQLLINALGEGTTNNGDNMNSQAGSLNTLVTALNGPATQLSVRKQQVNDIVLELQRFYDVLAKQREQVRQEFGTWTAVMQQLAGQEQSIGSTVRQADTLLQNLDAIVTGNGTNLHAALDQLPTTLTDLNSFLDQSNGILADISKYRGAIHDVFPNLGSSFFDTDPNNHNQHFWSVFSVTCSSNCTGQASAPMPNSAAPNASWAAAMGG